MKILKHKNLSRIYSIMTALAIMFVSLFSLISAQAANTKLFSGGKEQTNAISNYDAALNETDVNNAKAEISSALEYVVISQTGTTLNENNFRQISLTTTTPDAEDPTDETKYTINPEKVTSIAYVVGAFTIWPQTEIVEETEQCKEFSLTVIPLNTQTLVEDIANKTTIDINNSYDINLPAISKAAPLSSDALYQITITDSELNSVTFYIYQAPRISYENYGLVWQECVQTGLSGVTYTDISSPVEYQTYDSGYSAGNAVNGYLVLQLDYSKLEATLNKNLNSLYIDFWHNGQAFSLRVQNNGTGLDFYNNYASKLTGITVNGTNLSDNNGQLNSNALQYDTNTYTIKFNESGEYKVRIYDNTVNRLSSNTVNGEIVYSSLNGSPITYTEGLSNNVYSLANYNEHNFTVVNRKNLDGFYVTAKTQDSKGNEIYITNEIDCRNADSADDRTPLLPDSYYNQRTNKNVRLDFYNLSAIKSISYEKYAIEGYGVGKVVNPIEITNTTHISAQATEEGDYFYHIQYKTPLNVNLYKISSSSIESTSHASGIYYKTICFQLIKGVRAQYEFEDISNGVETRIHYPTSDDIVEVNKILTKNLSQTYTTNSADSSNIYGDSYEFLTYIFFEGLGDQLLFGYNTSSFVLNIAQSSPTISGIANNKSTNDKVDLTFTGVATDEVGMRIAVYKDGANIKNFDIKNENPSEALTYELSYTDLGSYRIVLTDAMNNSTEIRFAITQRQNAASIILIAIGVALAATVVILIVRVRSKVSVR